MQDELKILALDGNLLKFCRLLAFIDNPIVPESLFKRSTRDMDGIRRVGLCASRPQQSTALDVLTRFLFYAPAAVQWSSLLHLQSNERLNAAQVFNRDYSLNNFHEDIADLRSWMPLSRGKPSTMETLAMGSFHSASTVLEMFRIFLYSLPSQVVALLGFIAAKQQSFEAACYILELSISEVKELYGVVSIEYLITGIELVKCYNFLMEEADG
ncbi:hypothetical protein ACEPPN_009227 [Leptodophora sp. 'Broadleaf-Isolate-01']